MSLMTELSLSTLRTQGFNAALTQLKTSGIMSVIVAIPKLIAGLVAYRIENGKGMISTLGFKGALDALNISMKSFATAGIIAGIVGLIALYDVCTTTTAEWEEKLQDVKSELSELQSEGESLNNELKTTQDRINELQNKGSLTLIEENELKRLKQENAELQRKIDLNRLAQQEKQKETRETFVKTMDSDIFEDDNYSIDYNLGGKVVAGGGGKKTNESAYINQKFEDYKSYQDQLVQLEKDYLDKKISKDKYDAEKEIIDDQIKNIGEYLKGKYEDFAKNSEGLEYIIDPKTPEDEKYNEYLDYINEFNDRYIVAIGDTESITNLWNSILNRPKFSEANNALAELVNTGELTAESIAKLAQNNDNVAELLAYLNQLGLIDLSGVVKDSNDNDLIDADDIKNTKDFGNALDGIPGMFNKVKDSAKDTEEAVSDLADTFDKLDQISDALGDLDKAFSELKEDGKVTFSTLNNIQEKFSKLGNVDDEWLQKQINALAEAKGNTEATNKVLGELATKYVSAQFTANELANANQAVVASMLKEAGVANSNKVAMQMIANAKAEVAIANGDFTSKTWNEINALLSESGATKTATDALSIYWVKKQLADGYTLDTTQDVQQLLNMAKAAGITGAAVEAMGKIVKMTKSISQGDSPYNLSDVLKAKKELEEALNGKIKFDPVNFTGNTQNKSNNSSNSSSSYTATEDPWLKKRQEELDKVAHQHEMGKISEEKYLDNIQKIEEKFAPQIKKKQAEVDKLQKKYNNMSKSQRKSKSGQKLKKDLQQAKQDLKDIKKQDQDLQKEIHNLKLDNRKDDYEKFRDKQIEKYKNGKITLKKLNEVLSKKRKKLFGSFDKDTYNDYIESDKEKVNKAAVERRKTIYDEYKEAKIKEYEDGKITIKQLEKLLKDKIKSLFGDLDTETYNELLGDVPDDIKQALKDKFDLDMDKLDNRRDFDLIKDEDYYKEKLALAEEYYKQSEEFADDYTKALVEMYDYAKDQYINDLEKQKEALEEQKDAISDFYENQKKLLQDQSDNDTYLKDQTEKRKTVNDLKMQIAELERDTSEKSRKKIAELQDQLVNAEDELSDFEKQYALDQTIAMLEEMEEKHLESIDNQIKLIDNKITSINDNTGNTYKAIVDFAKKKYGVTIDVSKVGLATNNLGSLANNLTQPFLNMISSLWKQSSFATYASGTSSSVGGLVKTQESRLAELIGMNTGSGTFTMLTPSSKVWNNEATDFLYKFANNPTKSLLEKLGETTSSIAQNITTVNNSPTYNVNINKGAVVVQGNADEKVLEKSTKDLTYNILYELKKLK